LLVGLALARLWLKCADFKHVVVPRIALVLCFVLVSAVYAERTREQSKVWRNTESLWAYVLNNADYIPDQAYGAMGKVLEKKGDLEGATKYYRAAFSLNPEDARFRGLLALALAKQGLNEDALALCEELVAKEPGSPMSYLQLGRVFLQLERYDEAVSSFKKSMEISPGYQYAAALLVATYLKMNKLAEARELYAKYKDKGVLVSPDIDVELGGKILDPAEKSP
jgi:tetratricopeptide (TPR) repeat protein